jgi:hypothetical protein
MGLQTMVHTLASREAVGGTRTRESPLTEPAHTKATTARTGDPHTGPIIPLQRHGHEPPPLRRG